MEWNIKKQTTLSYEETIEKVKEALKQEGFGIMLSSMNTMGKHLLPQSTLPQRCTW